MKKSSNSIKKSIRREEGVKHEGVRNSAHAYPGYIHNMSEDGVKCASGTKPIVNFPKITCTRLQPNITGVHAPKEKLDTVVRKLFLANNS